MYYFCTSSSGHTNERTIRVVGDRTLEKGLPGTRRAIYDTFGLRDAEGPEEFGVLDGQFDSVLDFLNLLVETTDHLIRAVRDLVDRYE